MTDLLIRPERPDEDTAIGATHLHAFHEHHTQARLVALHRGKAGFDPELSLVAEYRDRVVAHALFMPRRIRLLGTDVHAVNLASIAVDPEFQGRGFGARVIREGHAVARAKGYSMSFVIGHPSFYTRFGYRPDAFGASTVEVPIGTLPRPSLTGRSVGEKDVPALHHLWSHEEGMVDFALEPGTRLDDWVSPNPNIRSTVYVRKRGIVGYMRVHTAHAARPHVFLAHDHAAALAMAADVAAEAGAQRPVQRISLPVHPASASAPVLGTPVCAAWGSGMALGLADSPFDDYYTQVQAGTRPTGRVIWPVEFEVE